MPSTIAIRMYCVNLLDIAYPRKFQLLPSVADFAADATASRRRCYRCGTCAIRLASYATHKAGPCAFLARQLHEEQPREEAMNDRVNRQILLVEKPAGKLGSQHFGMREGVVPD